MAIELDNRMIEILNKRFHGNTHFSLLHQDVLKVNLVEEIEKMRQVGAKQIKVVANLPYYITTPIIMKLLEEHLAINTITVMVQKEVAQRLTAVPGETYTGAITYAINYYTKPEMILQVPKESFLPEPEVDSSVIQLTVLPTPSVKVKDEEALFHLIKVAFMQKRKTLVNALENGGIAKKEQIEGALKQLGLNSKIRAEKMTLENFASLLEILC